MQIPSLAFFLCVFLFNFYPGYCGCQLPTSRHILCQLLNLRTPIFWCSTLPSWEKEGAMFLILPFIQMLPCAYILAREVYEEMMQTASYLKRVKSAERCLQFALPACLPSFSLNLFLASCSISTNLGPSSNLEDMIEKKDRTLGLCGPKGRSCHNILDFSVFTLLSLGIQTNAQPLLLFFPLDCSQL